MSLLSGLLDHMEPPRSFLENQPTAVDRSMAQPIRPTSRAQHTPQPHNPPRASATTATPEWRHARDQYLGHILVCRSCYAPTGRHCAAGTGLRATYDSTPMENHQ